MESKRSGWRLLWWGSVLALAALAASSAAPALPGLQGGTLARAQPGVPILNLTLAAEVSVDVYAEGYNAIDVYGDYIVLAGNMTGLPGDVAVVSVFNVLASHAATYAVSMLLGGREAVGLYASDVEVATWGFAFTGWAVADGVGLVVLVVLDHGGGLVCGYAGRVSTSAGVLDVYPGTARLEVEASKGRLVVGGYGALPDVGDSGFIAVFDGQCKPLGAVVFEGFIVEDIASDKSGLVYAVGVEEGRPGSMTLAVVDPMTPTWLTAAAYSHPGGAHLYPEDVDVLDDVVAVAGRLAAKNGSTAGLAAAFDAGGLASLWAAGAGPHAAQSTGFRAVKVLPNGLVLAAGDAYTPDPEVAVAEFEASSGALAYLGLYSQPNASHGMDADYTILGDEVVKYVAGVLDGGFPGSLQDHTPAAAYSNTTLAASKTELKAVEAGLQAVEASFSVAPLDAKLSEPGSPGRPDGLLVALIQPLTAPAVPVEPYCEPGYNVSVDLSTGTGPAFQAHPPGTPSDPVGDPPDWRLVNATRPLLPQPVTVTPYPGWYDSYPVGVKAAWISVHATEDGRPYRYGDAVYAIDFNVARPGYLEIWFTADDAVELVLHGPGGPVSLGTASDYRNLSKATAQLAPGAYTLYAIVDDRAAVVSGFLAYGWTCEAEETPGGPTTTVTVTVTETETQTVTVTQTETRTECCTVTETDVVTVTQPADTGDIEDRLDQIIAAIAALTALVLAVLALLLLRR